MHGLSRFLSGHLSISHAPPSISHPYKSPHDLEGISLSQTHPLSLPMRPSSPCVPLDLCPLLIDLYWTSAIGVSLSIANNHALAIFMYLLTSLFYLGDACVICLHKKRKNTHSLSNLSFVVSFSFTHTYSFCTLTHSPSHALDLS